MIKLYSTGCPKCEVIKKKLEAKNIKYIECGDVEEMKARGIRFLPVIEVDGQLLEFSEANKWINEQ